MRDERNLPRGQSDTGHNPQSGYQPKDLTWLQQLQLKVEPVKTNKNISEGASASFTDDNIIFMFCYLRMRFASLFPVLTR